MCVTVITNIVFALSGEKGKSFRVHINQLCSSLIFKINNVYDIAMLMSTL